MKTFLFIPARNYSGVAANEWHIYDNVTKQIRHDPNDFDGTNFEQRYLGLVDNKPDSIIPNGEALIYDAKANALVFVSRRRVCDKTGVLLITQFDDSHIRFAEYLGSAPEWIQPEISYRDIETHLPEEWFVANNTNTMSLGNAITILDELLDHKKVTLRFNDAFGYNDGCGLIKKALLCLPRRVSNSISFNSNCTTVAAIDSTTIGLSPLQGLDINIAKLYTDPTHAFTKLILEKGNTDFLETWEDVATIDELEAKASVELLKLYCSQLTTGNVAEAITLCKRIESDKPQDITDDLKDAIMSMAYRVHLSPVFFTVEPQTRGMLLNLIKSNKYSGHGLVPIIKNNFINEVGRHTVEEQLDFIRSVFSLRHLIFDPGAKDFLTKFLYGRMVLPQDTLSAFSNFLNEMSDDDFMDFISNLTSPFNQELQAIATQEFNSRYTPYKRPEIFNRLLDLQTQLDWLVPIVFNEGIMQNMQDLLLWEAAINHANCKSMEPLIKRQFGRCFGLLLDSVGYMRPPQEISTDLLDKLDELYSIANKFEYEEKQFLVQKKKIIKYQERLQRGQHIGTILFGESGRRSQMIRNSLQAEGISPKTIEPSYEMERHNRLTNREVKEAKVNHLGRGLSLPIALSFVVVLFILSIFILYVAYSEVFRWEQYHILMNSIGMGRLPIKSMCLYLPVVACLLIYGIMIVCYKVQRFNASFIARRAAIVSFWCVILPYIMFILTMVIYYYVN